MDHSEADFRWTPRSYQPWLGSMYSTVTPWVYGTTPWGLRFNRSTVRSLARALVRSYASNPALRLIGARGPPEIRFGMVHRKSELRGPLGRCWSKMPIFYFCLPYGRWEALHICKRVSRGVGVFSAIERSILRTFNNLHFVDMFGKNGLRPQLYMF